MSTQLDLTRLGEEQEKLNKRGGDGSKNWIQLSKLEKPLDVRIMDPLPSMDGIYYVEVPTWWINGKRLISKKIYGPEEKDVVEEMKKEAELAAVTDKTLSEILSKKNSKGIPLIQFKWEYWVPVLQFAWQLDNKNVISGITTSGQYDVNLIKKFIVDDRVKIAVANITVIKAINVIATTRGNSNFLDPVEGMNIVIRKSGEGRDTKYAVAAAERMPMPLEFYQEGKLTDPFEIAESLMYTDEYMELVMGNYLYGDVQIPAEADSNYEHLDIRKKLKDKFSETAVEEAPTPRRRPGAAAPTAPDPAPVVAPEAAHAARRHAATTPPTPTGRKRRNLVDDLKETA
jgi:hypothetical protein